jgi:hypothetical protein
MDAFVEFVVMTTYHFVLSESQTRTDIFRFCFVFVFDLIADDDCWKQGKRDVDNFKEEEEEESEEEEANISSSSGTEYHECNSS